MNLPALTLPGILVTHQHHGDLVQQYTPLRTMCRTTLPHHMEIERKIKPFLRCTEPAATPSAPSHGAASNEPLAVFAALREWKNNF